jgi:hypothetical protein
MGMLVKLKFSCKDGYLEAIHPIVCAITLPSGECGWKVDIRNINISLD